MLMSTVHYEAGALPRRPVVDGQNLSRTDPALLTVTDFKRERPVTVDVERQIDDALNDMINLGVRALLVVKEQRIVGLITSYDIQGERPIQFLQSSNYAHHRDVRVAHVMTPWPALQAIDWQDLQSLQVGDLLDLLEEAKLTHIIIVERVPEDPTCVVRALVSRARLLRQLVGAGTAAPVGA